MPPTTCTQTAPTLQPTTANSTRHLRARPGKAETRPAQTDTAPDQRTAFMPVDDPPHNRQAQPVPTRRAGTTVVDAHEGRKNLLPRLFRNARAVVVHVDAALLRAQLIADAHLGLGMAHRVADQVLQRPVQITRLGLDPGRLALFRRETLAARDPDIRAQRGQFGDNLIDQRTQIDALKIQGRRALLQARVSEHFIDQLVEVLNVAVHAAHVLEPRLGRGGVADHLQTKTQPRHRRAQLVRHGAHQFALDHQRALQVLGHAVERRRHTPDRIRTLGGHAGLQAALRDQRGRGFQFQHASLQAPHQQINHQTDETQPQQGNQQQPVQRIGVHLVQRADLQHPVGVDNPGQHANRIAALAQRHHRVAFIDAAALIVIQVSLIQRQQVHVEAKTLVDAQRLQTRRLLIDRKTHQLVDQQVNSRPRQLLGDLLNFAGQQQRLRVTQLAIDPGGVRPHLLDHHLATRQPTARAAVQMSLLDALQAQGYPHQPLPDRKRTAPLDGVERKQIVGQDRKCAVGQPLAVLLAALLIEHMQGQYAEQRDQHQNAEHTAVDAQKDRVHQVSR
ncbi:hypothetical protein ALP19_05775 [Pseudomonas syringae pv. tomato]|nr:hypothetical protein ALP19_05775 [Pseudomonas syringae pv. tomato]